MYKLILLFSFVFPFNALSQVDNSEYHPPLDIPLILASNFGEIRTNHFHMGIDIKTNGREGYKLYAIEKGFVSRIKVSPYGYGKAVYIDHPNGKTSVYAHCSEFLGKLDSIVKMKQQNAQSFEVDFKLDKSEIPIKKGEVFALSGNSGGSSGPHLHFEIRETLSERCLNPLIYGFDLADTRAPEIFHVKAYGVNEQGYLIPGKFISKRVYKSGSEYHLSGNSLSIISSFATPSGGVGLAFDVIDRLNGAYNKCGVYGTYLIVDEDTIFGQKINEISFDHTRYVNSHSDFSVRGRNYHKAFKNTSNPINFYINDQLGIFRIYPGESKNIKYIAYDTKGNESILQFTLNVLNGKLRNDFNPSDEDYWYPEKKIIIQKDNWQLQADSFSIYEPQAILDIENPHICQTGVLLQKKVLLKVKLNDATYNPEKYYLNMINSDKRNQALKTYYEDGWLHAKTNRAGSVEISSDVQKPTLKYLSKSNDRVVFYVNDSESGLNKYDLYIDGKWHVLEFDAKRNHLIFKILNNLSGLHDVSVVVTDNCNNKSEWSSQINF